MVWLGGGRLPPRISHRRRAPFYIHFRYYFFSALCRVARYSSINFPPVFFLFSCFAFLRLLLSCNNIYSRIMSVVKIKISDRGDIEMYRKRARCGGNSNCSVYRPLFTWPFRLCAASWNCNLPHKNWIINNPKMESNGIENVARADNVRADNNLLASRSVVLDRGIRSKTDVSKICFDTPLSVLRDH